MGNKGQEKNEGFYKVTKKIKKIDKYLNCLTQEIFEDNRHKCVVRNENHEKSRSEINRLALNVFDDKQRQIINIQGEPRGFERSLGQPYLKK